MVIQKRIWFAAVVIGLLAGVAWLVLRPHEPIYRGRPLSAWLEESRLRGYSVYGYREEVVTNAATAVVRDLGTNLLPLLVRMLETPRSIPRLVVDELARDSAFRFLHLSRQITKHDTALGAFRVLGPAAQPAVPAVARLLRNKDPWVRIDAARCLGILGPVAGEAVPALIAAWNRSSGPRWEDTNLRQEIAVAWGEIGPAARAAIPCLEASTNDFSQVALVKIRGDLVQPLLDRLEDTSNLRRWSRSVWLVGLLGSNAAPAIPLLLATLRQTNCLIVPNGETMQETVLEALARIRQRPDLCVPAVIPWIEADRALARRRALRVLRAFGPEARAATPQVAALLTNYDEGLRIEGTNAWRDIDPVGAAAAGIP